MSALTSLRRVTGRAALAILLLLAAVTICDAQSSSPPPPQQQQSSGLNIVPGNTQQAPSGPSINVAVSAPAGYLLSANDSIGVEVFGEDDLKTVGRLNAEGNISLPLIGSVRLMGLTVTQATQRVTELYAKDYLINPRVNVVLLGYAKRRFTVLGQVNRPGSYEMPETSPGGIDLLEAIAIAGGYTRIAAPERVSVRRKGSGGKDEVIRVNAKKLERGNASVGNFKVQPGDTITIGESLF